MSKNKINIKELKAVVEILPMPVCIINSERVLVEINPAAMAAFPNMTTGQNLVFYLREPDFLEACDTAIKTGNNAEVEIEELGPPKRHFKVQLRGLKANHVMLIFTDVTIDVESEKTRTNFVANVSHELRSPLTTLMGCIETLQGPATNDKTAQAKFLELMGQEANRMKRIVNDLLSLAKTETTAHLPPSDKVDMVEVIERTASVLENQAHKKKMNFALNLPKTKAVVKGERDQLIQVLHNLVDNAIKYGNEGSDINISLESLNGEHMVSVTNKGDKIPSEKLPRLTERFYRLDKSRSRDVDGTGLGLAIVKHIINRHRGGLDVESTKEGKTTFTVSLPKG